MKNGTDGLVYSRSVGLLLVLPLILAVAGGAVAGDAADAYLSPVERQVLDELNLARTDPQRYAEFLAAMRRYFNGNHLEYPGQPILVTREGAPAVDEAVDFLRAIRPLPPLIPSRGLSLAAQAHVDDQQSGAMGHTGSDNSQPWDRMNRYGAWQDEVAENIAYGGYSARGVVIQLIVDDGVPGRQHRRNIFNPDYRFVGVACGTHTRLHDMCVMDFAARYTEQENASDQDY
jgi:uncharacterized protein YkwD